MSTNLDNIQKDNFLNAYKFVQQLDKPEEKETFLTQSKRLQYAMSKPSAKEEVNKAVLEGDITTNKEYKEMERYGAYAKHAIIIEGIDGLTVEDISRIAKRHTQATGSAPIVVVDYLQLIEPSVAYTDPHTADKQHMDRAALRLIRMCKICTILIKGFFISGLKVEG